MLPVSQFMSDSVETVSIDDPLAFVLHKMDVGGYRHLPVVENGKPVDIVSVRDMLRYITKLARRFDRFRHRVVSRVGGRHGMTTFEHAILGVTVALAAGCQLGGTALVFGLMGVVVLE